MKDICCKVGLYVFSSTATKSSVYSGGAKACQCAWECDREHVALSSQRFRFVDPRIPFPPASELHSDQSDSYRTRVLVFKKARQYVQSKRLRQLLVLVAD